MSLAAIKDRLETALDDMPDGCARTNVLAALGMLDDVIEGGKGTAASQLGQLGGSVTAQRGPDYFRQLAARRKTHGGGRPRKVVE
jgi:hypothetical protein